jgi:hypothetical protein
MASMTLPDVRGLHLQAPDHPEFIEVPPHDFLVVDGSGGPASAAFFAAADVLVAVSYPIALAVGPPAGVDDRIGPLEALWSSSPNPLTFDPVRRDPSTSVWTLMIRQPDGVPDDLHADAVAAAERDLGADAVAGLRLWRWEEGPCVQVMHRGPVEALRPTIAQLHQYVAESGLRLRGRHHEIFLTDPRRCPPDRMRTVIRHPVC